MKRYSGEDYSFVINRAKLDDRGEYIIRAENHYGAREEPVFLNVQREYTFFLASVPFSLLMPNFFSVSSQDFYLFLLSYFYFLFFCFFPYILLFSSSLSIN